VRVLERGPEGRHVKRYNGYRCQLCEAIGNHPIGFETERGEPYIEAHHAVPVSKLEPGTLHRSYTMTLCANHHCQLHYGKEVFVDLEHDFFVIQVGSHTYRAPRCLK
jgi:predicted HNH restriction endonuclease